tara:strand:+ start:399 stop:503 length:105 start_codon:yes stop_codon:yes gene_type:complete
LLVAAVVEDLRHNLDQQEQEEQGEVLQDQHQVDQ